MQSSKTDFTQFTVPQLEAFVNARSQVIIGIQAEMGEIQSVIAVKNRHWLEVERFAGMTDQQIADFKALSQGVAFSETKQFQQA